jgi:hypothetical protein
MVTTQATAAGTSAVGRDGVAIDAHENGSHSGGLAFRLHTIHGHPHPSAPWNGSR